MEEETVLVCAGDRQRLLLDLNALGYRLRPVEGGTDTRATVVRIANDEETGAAGKFGLAPGRYCHTRSVENALMQARSHRRPLLVTGETGTGKEVFARAVCDAPPAKGACSVIHCQALRWAAAEECCTACVDERIYTALRGHPSLLLLDEVGDLGPECQEAALEALVHVDKEQTRIVVTSNRPIETLLERGALLPQFVSTLQLSQVHLPALRDQPADIPLLMEWFVAEANRELGTCVEGFAPPAIRQAVSHTWPGNVREMRNVVFRSVLNQPNGWIEKLPFDGQEATTPSLGALIRRHLPEGTGEEAQALMQQFERELLRVLSELHRGNKSRIARALQVSRNTLKNRLRCHNL